MTKHIAAATLVAGSMALANPSAAVDLSGLKRPRALMGASIKADADPAVVLADLQRSVAAFRTEYDEKLKAKADAVTDEKVGKINDDVGRLQAAVDEVNLKLASAQLSGGAGGQTAEKKAYAETFNKWFRKGDEAAANALGGLAVKAAMTTQSDPDGGMLVPVEMEQEITRVQGLTSTMRQIAQVLPIGGTTYKKQVSLGGAGSGWVGETDTRAETGTPTLDELTFETGEIYAKPKATQSLLDDARVDLAAWLAGEVNIEFDEKEGLAFVLGNGVKKPRGFLDYDKIADASYAWGKLGFVVSTDANLIKYQGLIDLVQAPKTGYRANSRFLMNRKTVGALRGMIDGEGRPLWQPSLQLGQPQSLLGYPISEDDNMPDVAAGAYPIGFGDYRRGYLIIDRLGVRVLRDPYSSKPYVEFYTTKRVGGGVQDFAAIKLLKISA